MVRIALVQMSCEKAAIAENIRVMENHVIEAERRGVDIIGFPEMSIGIQSIKWEPRYLDGPARSYPRISGVGHHISRID
jgi:predicted amidohydrolase